MSISFTTILKVSLPQEEKLLHNMFQSVKDWTCDMTVVDNGCSPNALAICRHYGVNIVTDFTQGDLSYLRNVGLQFAKGEWIFSLDSDESLAKKDIKKVIKLTKNNKADGYHLWSRYYTSVPDICHNLQLCKGEYPTEEQISQRPYYVDIMWAVRLFRNHKGFHYQGIIHEMVDGTVWERGGYLDSTHKIPLHHFKELTVVGDGLQEARDRFEMDKKNDVIPFFNSDQTFHWIYRMGRDYLLIENDPAKSHYYFDRCLKAASEQNKRFDHYFWFLKAWVYWKQNESLQALACLERARRVKSDYFGALYLSGVLEHEMGDYETAEKYFRQAQKINPQHPIIKKSLATVLKKEWKYKEFDKMNQQELMDFGAIEILTLGLS